MPEPIPSTFFTDPAHWRWLVIGYFFVGGIAGGAFFIAALLDLIGRPTDRALARIGYYVALPAIVLGGIFLILDLTRPERFWHMLVQSETGRPMLKWWSPISFGAWGMTVFGLFAFLGFLRALAEDGYTRGVGLTRVFTGLPWRILAVIGGFLGLFVAGYTGVLLSVTNRPIWADTNLVGLVFLLSGASTAAATIILLVRGRRGVLARSVQRLESFDTWIMALELVALTALIASLGAVARVWLSWWGVLFLLGVVLAGLLVPLVLHLAPRPDPRASTTAAVLVLIGGFLLRVVVVLASERVPHGGF